MPAPQQIRRLVCTHDGMPAAYSPVFGIACLQPNPLQSSPYHSNPANGQKRPVRPAFNYDAGSPAHRLSGRSLALPSGRRPKRRTGRRTGLQPIRRLESWPLSATATSPGPTRDTPEKSGFGWYRFTVVLPAMHPPLAHSNLDAYRDLLPGLHVDGLADFGQSAICRQTSFPTADWSFHVPLTFPQGPAPITPSRQPTPQICSCRYPRLALADLV
jgi:hypothetical protein